MAGQTASPRWTQRPAGSNWGDFGPDDQLGRLNFITPEKVRQGVAEVSEGRSFCLSLPLDLPGGNALNARRFPPELRPILRGDLPNMNYPLRRDNPTATDVVSDDLVLLYLQYSTQWDSLAHVGQLFDANGDGQPEMVYYNGFRAGIEVIGPIDYDKGDAVRHERPGARRLGIENVAASCVQGRAVMIDLAAHYGTGRRIIGYRELQHVLDADGIVVEKGDIVCLHTGFSQVLLDMAGKPDVAVLNNTGAALDGRDEKLLQWITDSGLAAIAADNYAVESLPATHCDGDSCASLPLHAHCLFRLGIHLGELWYLGELAAWLRQHKRSRFLLTAPPLRLPGAVGSPLTPVATV